jgi:hypothetical protein
MDMTAVASEFGLLAREMREAYSVAQDAMAHRELSLLAPGRTGTPPASETCPGGGGITIAQGAGGSLSYLYVDCVTGGYTFNGNATMTPSNQGAAYGIDLGSVSVTHPGGYSATLDGNSNCVVGAGGTQCVTTQSGFRWGYDITYVASTGLAGGTHQCNCGTQRTWNVVFDDFGATSGTAYIYATNGTAIVERTSANTFTVTRLIGETLLEDVPVTLPPQ